MGGAGAEVGAEGGVKATSAIGLRGAQHAPLTGGMPVMNCHPGKLSYTRHGRGEGAHMEPLDFRKFAEECLRLADHVQSIEDKSVLLRMAQVWIRIADHEPQVYRLIGEIGPQSL